MANGQLSLPEFQIRPLNSVNHQAMASNEGQVHVPDVTADDSRKDGGTQFCVGPYTTPLPHLSGSWPRTSNNERCSPKLLGIKQALMKKTNGLSF